MDATYCHIVANPAAGGGKSRHVLAELRDLLRTNFAGDITFYTTKTQGDARGSAREAVRDGSRLIVIIGGDGTVTECVNGIYALPPALTQDVTIAIVSTGTGCGLAQSLGIPTTFGDQIAVACEAHTRPIDLGKLHFEKTDRITLFANECQIGIGAEVVRKTRRHSKALGGSMAYALATLPLLFTYKSPLVAVEVEGAPPISLSITGISIGTGAITGGGMQLTPRAKLDDGLLDLLIMKGQSSLHRAVSFAGVRSGRHIHSPRFEYKQFSKVRITSRTRLLVSADGEMAGNLPATFEVLPQAMRVHCPTQIKTEVVDEHLSSAA